MFKPLLVSLSVVVATIPAIASASYLNYTKDAGTNIITDGSGLEWMTLSQTNVMSVEEALNSYAEDGWFVASSQEVDQLYDDFFGEYDWTGDRGTYVSQYASSSLTSITNESVDHFFGLFGKTALDDYCYDFVGSLYTCEIEGERYPQSRTNFFFSSTELNVSDDTFYWTFNSARVVSEYGQVRTHGLNGRIIPANVAIDTRNPGRFTSKSDGYAIALTRSVPDGSENNQNDASEVPAPGALSLFGLGLIAMMLRRKKL